MRLALLSPIHGQSIGHIARQLENYRVFLAPFELRHYFHVPHSQEDKAAIRAWVEKKQKEVAEQDRLRQQQWPDQDRS